MPGKPHGKRSLVGYSSWGHKRIRHNLETKATTIPYFNVPPLAGLCRYCNFYELKVRGNPVSNKSTGRKVKVKVKLLSHARLFTTTWIVACTKLLHPWDFRDKSTGVGCRFLLQGIFPTQGSNPGLSHCRQMFYCLSHQGSPKETLYVSV